MPDRAGRSIIVTRGTGRCRGFEVSQRFIFHEVRDQDYFLLFTQATSMQLGIKGYDKFIFYRVAQRLDASSTRKRSKPGLLPSVTVYQHIWDLA